MAPTEKIDSWTWTTTVLLVGVIVGAAVMYVSCEVII